MNKMIRRMALMAVPGAAAAGRAEEDGAGDMGGDVRGPPWRTGHLSDVSPLPRRRTRRADTAQVGGEKDGVKKQVLTLKK